MRPLDQDTVSRFRPPQQSRSQETLDRILDAAERVLDSKSFNEATLAEIVEQAGVTVGAFYRRFPDKDALLHHLDERFFAELHERADALLDESRWAGVPLAQVVGEFAVQAVTLYRERRGLLRSLFLRARTDAVIQQSAQRLYGHYIERLQQLCAERRGELHHPDRELAVPLGFKMFMGALREITLFGEVWPAGGRGVALDDAALGAELARLLLAYLGALR